MKIELLYHLLFLTVSLLWSVNGFPSAGLKKPSGVQIITKLIRTLRICPQGIFLGKVYDAIIEEEIEDNALTKVLVLKTTENFAIEIDWYSMFSSEVLFKKIPLNGEIKPPSRSYTVLDNDNQWMVLLHNLKVKKEKTIKIELYELTVSDEKQKKTI